MGTRYAVRQMSFICAVCCFCSAAADLVSDVLGGDRDEVEGAATVPRLVQEATRGVNLDAKTAFRFAHCRLVPTSVLA